ncbi:MAG TPA: MarR family transcriptional regulator [Syntrophales bacterium]|nr:MarR family transcriptional regulator [Syntrophales bacterium]HOM06365.1 MarR family transcriptional regulator [Syntrophales bacterium]HON99184.1 MarR family transcriptional regulator [Syntrophales bacterium]HPC00292.1 MarR family transcriptional regulator [Syntrophales bacterium]HPQ05955.1 MarR family transcriptional regulator [Syntrophales bacterium]
MAQGEDRLIFLLFTAQNKLRTYINAALAAAEAKVTIVQAGILFLLKERDGRTMSDLSQYLGVDNSTLTGLVDRLERAGLVVRRPSPSDRRALIVEITPAGREEAQRAKGVIRPINEAIKEGFAPEEIAAFKAVLGAFGRKFDRNGEVGA